MLKRPSSKAAGESKPEAYPLGYVEDFDEPRTKLADFFSILLDAACAASRPMIVYHRCIWSGERPVTTEQEEGFVVRDRRGGSGPDRPSVTSPAASGIEPHQEAAPSDPHQGSGIPVTFSSFVISLGSSSMMLMGRTIGSPSTSDAAESTAGERHYRLTLGLGKQDDGQSHDGRTSGAEGYALRPSDEVREFGCQVVVPPAAYRPQTCLSAALVDATWETLLIRLRVNILSSICRGATIGDAASE